MSCVLQWLRRNVVDVVLGAVKQGIPAVDLAYSITLGTVAGLCGRHLVCSARVSVHLLWRRTVPDSRRDRDRALLVSTHQGCVVTCVNIFQSVFVFFALFHLLKPAISPSLVVAQGLRR